MAAALTYCNPGRAEPAHPAFPPRTVAVSCWGREPAGACWGGCTQLRWCGKLEVFLSALLPCKVGVVCGKRGWGGVTYAHHFEEMVARHRPSLVASHLGHCDVYSGAESPKVHHSMAAAESVTRRALSLGASFAHLQPAVPELAARRPLCAPPEGVRQQHQALALRYGGAVLSLRAATCGADPLLGPLRHWTGGCSPVAASCQAGIDRVGAKCWLHPGPHTHHVYAALLAERHVESAAFGGVQQLATLAAWHTRLRVWAVPCRRRLQWQHVVRPSARA